MKRLDDQATAGLELVTVSGPSQVSIALEPPGPVTIGRRSTHTVDLSDARVSRDHAEIVRRREAGGGWGWLIRDLGSKVGTWLNGRQVEPGRAEPLAPGDQVEIGPWTFRVRGTGAAQPVSVSTIDDQGAATIVSRLDVGEADAVERRKLALLLEFADAIHAADDKSRLAEAVLDAAVAGTGFANAAVLAPMSDDDRIEVIAHRGAIVHDASAPRLSRSLIREASSGSPARLARKAGAAEYAHSIEDLNIDEALCVPILLGTSVAGFLYLDARSGGATAGGGTRDAGGFAVCLARLAAMALANLMRLDSERRHAWIEAELSAASQTQQYLMPPRTGAFGPFRYVGECRPGRYVGGDFFDVMPMDEGRLAVAVGDVTGKGVPAAVVMTASKGFLHAALEQHGDPGRAVTDLNRYIEHRCRGERLLTLWVGVLDAKGRTLTYVDAGHGYGMMVLTDGEIEALNRSRGSMIGVMPDVSYETATVPLAPDGRILIVSDGLIEQQAAGAERFEPYGVDRVRGCVRAVPAGEDEVAALFAAVEEYGGTTELADDATAVLVRW